jgi:hypothetical protein
MSAAVSLPLPPSPLELVVRGKEKTVAYACPSCGAVFTTYTFGRDSAADQAARYMASAHCHGFCACGETIGKSRSRCDRCWHEHLAASEEKVFQAAKKVRLEDYPAQPVYWNNNDRDGFFIGIDEVLDRCEEEGLEVPKYVWAAREVPFALNADYLIDRAIEDHGEDVRDELADKELQTLLDQWCRRQDVKSWQPDYTTAVLLHPEE